MPRNVTITLSNGKSHTYRNVPDDVTPDQIEQRASAEFPSLRVTNISGGRNQVAEPEPGSLASFGKGALAGAANVILKPAEWLVSGMEAMGVPGASTAPGKLDRARAQQQLERYKQAHPNWFTAGEIAGETAASAPLISAGGAGLARAGGRLAQVAPKAGGVVQRVGRAVQTGGIGAGRTAAQTANLGKAARAGQLIERMTGGAIAGAGGAALSGQDVPTSAAFGAGVPVVASVLRRIGGRVADITKMPRVKAAQIIRESLGANEEAARTAFAELSPDDQRLARQVLIDAGVEPRVFMGLGADVERLRPDEINAVLEQQAAQREARLAQAANGATMEEVRAAARAGRKAVSSEMGPARQAAFERIATTNEAVAGAEQAAALARQQAARAASVAGTQQNVARRLTGAEALFGESPAFARGADVARYTSEQAAQKAADLRSFADDQDAFIAELAAEGLQPARAAPVIAKLREVLENPRVKVDDLQSHALKRLIRKFELATDKNGMLQPAALGQIRKTGVNDIVEGWMNRVSRGSAPSSGNLQRASSLALQARDLIDNVLDSADWREYLSRSERGYAAVNRGELAGEALRLYKQDPTVANEFRALIRGDRPKVVGKIMGGGPQSESFTGAFADDPMRLAALQRSSQEIETLNRMGELGRQGSTAAAELINRERPFLSRSLTRMGLAAFPPARIGAEASETALSAYLQPRIQRELSNAFATGQNALSLMNQYPGSLRVSEQLSQLPPEIRNALSQMTVKGIAGNYPLVNPDTGEVLVGVGEIDGQPYPMYGPASQNSMRR